MVRTCQQLDGCASHDHQWGGAHICEIHHRQVRSTLQPLQPSELRRLRAQIIQHLEGCPRGRSALGHCAAKRPQCIAQRAESLDFGARRGRRIGLTGKKPGVGLQPGIQIVGRGERIAKLTGLGELCIDQLERQRQP